jgi:hypothetical protein
MLPKLCCDPGIRGRFEETISMATMKRLFPLMIVGSILLWAQQALADKQLSVTIQRMTYDSDVVFLGRAVNQTLIHDGFVFIDTDGMEKKLDIGITSFSIDDALKGPNRPRIEVCTILSPLKYADIEVGKIYLMFLQETGMYSQRTYGSMSQIEIVDGKVGANFFHNGYKELKTVKIAIASIRRSAAQRRKRLQSTPYNPYESEPYKIVKNVCAVSS